MTPLEQRYFDEIPANVVKVARRACRVIDLVAAVPHEEPINPHFSQVARAAWVVLRDSLLAAGIDSPEKAEITGMNWYFNVDDSLVRAYPPDRDRENRVRLIFSVYHAHDYA